MATRARGRSRPRCEASSRRPRPAACCRTAVSPRSRRRVGPIKPEAVRVTGDPERAMTVDGELLERCRAARDLDVLGAAVHARQLADEQADVVVTEPDEGDPVRRVADAHLIRDPEIGIELDELVRECFARLVERHRDRPGARGRCAERWAAGRPRARRGRCRSRGRAGSRCAPAARRAWRRPPPRGRRARSPADDAAVAAARVEAPPRSGCERRPRRPAPRATRARPTAHEAPARVWLVGAHAASPPTVARRRSSARDVRDFTVPRRMPRVVAVSSSDMSSRKRQERISRSVVATGGRAPRAAPASARPRVPPPRGTEPRPPRSALPRRGRRAPPAGRPRAAGCVPRSPRSATATVGTARRLESVPVRGTP